MRVDPAQAQISLYTWGSKVPRQFTPVSAFHINVSALRDPQSNRGYSKKYTDGRPGEIQAYVKEDPRVPAILDTVRMLSHLYIRSEASPASKWLSIALVDYHGKWIAPALGEIIADDLSNSGYKVSLFHYDIWKDLNKEGSK